ILWVKANKLLPLHSGGDIRSFHFLRHLSSHHKLIFLSYYDGGEDKQYETELRNHFPSAQTVSTRKNAAPVSRGLDYLRNLPSPAPYAVSRFASPPVREKIRSLLETGGFDVVVSDFLDAAINFPDHLTIPGVLFQHNVESEIWRRHATTESNPAKRLMYQFEFKKMLRYEQSIIRRFRHIIAVSEHDRALMQPWAGNSKITIVPTGVDVAQYRPSSETHDTAPIVMFVGSMDWEPNIDAVEFFRNEIWPLVTAKIPAARFVIVGRNPDRRVQKLASSSIEITGRVASVADQLQKAAVVIVPLRIGGGTRLKIYEAMAAGKAVVSTTVGAEGLDVSPGRDIGIADNPADFAGAVVSLLNDRDLRRRYERAASETAGKYDWSVIAAKFAEALESVAAKTTSVPF
ncbi:MAG: glycosyltransferase family 4 protein, partial [Terriglobales bacterium]